MFDEVKTRHEGEGGSTVLAPLDVLRASVLEIRPSSATFRVSGLPRREPDVTYTVPIRPGCFPVKVVGTGETSAERELRERVRDLEAELDATRGERDGFREAAKLAKCGHPIAAVIPDGPDGRPECRVCAADKAEARVADLRRELERSMRGYRDAVAARVTLEGTRLELEGTRTLLEDTRAELRGAHLKVAALERNATADRRDFEHLRRDRNAARAELETVRKELAEAEEFLEGIREEGRSTCVDDGPHRFTSCQNAAGELVAIYCPACGAVRARPVGEVES